MQFVYLILEKKGLDQEIISRMKRIFQNNSSIIVIKNVLGRKIPNTRESLRQVDIPSINYFVMTVDPFLIYLERSPKGFKLISLETDGPRDENNTPLEICEQFFRGVGYTDDVKMIITSYGEFLIVINACIRLEKPLVYIFK